MTKSYILADDGSIIGELLMYDKPTQTSTKVALVIGHDAKSQGAYGDSGISEFTFNDELIGELSFKQMLPKNVYVFYRSADISGYTAQMKDVHERMDKIGIDVSIELHFNGSDNASVTGNEFLYCSNAGKQIAMIFDETFDSLPNNDRGIKKIQFHPYPQPDDRGAGFCCRGKSIAIIAEPFFSLHQSDYIYGGQHRELLLKAYSTAIKKTIAYLI